MADDDGRLVLVDGGGTALLPLMLSLCDSGSPESWPSGDLEYVRLLPGGCGEDGEGRLGPACDVPWLKVTGTVSRSHRSSTSEGSLGADMARRLNTL